MTSNQEMSELLSVCPVSNQIEIQNIRHICGHAGNFCAKINYYKTLTSDTNITTVLDDITQECSSIKTELSNML